MVAKKGPGVTPGKTGYIKDLRQGATPGKSGSASSSRIRTTSRTGKDPPSPPPKPVCPKKSNVESEAAQPMFEVNISSSSESEPESEVPASEESSESSYSAEYTYLTDSGSEKENPRNAARKTLGNFAARTREREEQKGGERQDKKTDKEQGLRKTARGDLSAVEQLEEDYESYHKKGGRKDRQQFYDDQRFAGFEQFLKQDLRMRPNASEHDFAAAQWDILLRDAAEATFSHLKKGEDLKVGIHSQKNLDRQAYANMTATAILNLRRQGDLILNEIPDSLFFTKGDFQKWRPICDAETLNLWECDIYLFSDSVLKLGTKKGGDATQRWVNKYQDGLAWLPKSSDLRLKTIHGQSFRYHWDVEAGATTSGLLKNVKRLVNEKAGGDPSKFKDRVVIFSCLNDLNDLPPYKEGCKDTLLSARTAAKEMRDYISKFRIGHFVWLGPGSEKVWQYDLRTPPLVWQPRADAFMDIIEEAGHPIFTGGISLRRGKLIYGGQNEHFTADWNNVEMLIQFIYDSNALASFIAMWELLPSKPKLPAKASSSAGGDPVRRKVTVIPSSSAPPGTAKQAAESRKRAAGDRSDNEASATEDVPDRKKRSARKRGTTQRQRATDRGRRMNQKAIPSSINLMLYNQLLEKLAAGSQLNSQEAVETISRLAKFPFTIRPGDWFKTRPFGTSSHMPVPECREISIINAHKPRLGVTPAKESHENSSEDTEEIITACLPHNYKIGPVYSVYVRKFANTWQMLVEVPSIANTACQGSRLKSFVIISHGITQWARWQGNTGDPKEGGFDPLAPKGGKKWAKGDLGMAKVNRNVQGVDDRFENWQKPCRTGELLALHARSWYQLPSKNEGKINWISRIAARVLRHDSLHDKDASVLFKLFYQRMTQELWRALGEECKQYVRSPQILLQTIIRGSDKVRYQVCWQTSKQLFPELMTEAYRNSDETPIYIRAVQGHSGDVKVDINLLNTWEVTEKHTFLLYHAGYRHNIDSILRNGLLAGGVKSWKGRRNHCYFSIMDNRNVARGDPSVKSARGDPCSGDDEDEDDKEGILRGVTTRPYPAHHTDLDTQYQIDVRRARELGLHFYQTPSCAVLCDECIPPECISKIIDWDGHVLYRNADLSKCAPGDRPAYVQAGSDLSRTKFHYDYSQCSTNWDTVKIDKAKAERSALFMKQYCSRFHNENICAKCYTFNLKGLIYCVKCGATGRVDPSKTRCPSALTAAQDHIDFANAELKTLVWKANPKFRGRITNPDSLLRKRAKKHLQSAKQKGFRSIIERYNICETYRKNCKDGDLTIEDVLKLQELAEQRGHEVTMPLAERKIRMAQHAWDVVQESGGGQQTVGTKLYPEYHDAVQAKASAASSSSSSWHRDWWSQSSTTPPWRHSEWWQRKW